MAEENFADAVWPATVPDQRPLASGESFMKKYLWLLLISSFVLLPVAIAQQDETTRKLWDTAFIDQPKRPAGASYAKRRYRIATPNVSPARVAADTVVGVT